MSALFKKIDYTLSSLMESISLGQIGLPDLQRPFVWPNKKVRDLFDSMYRGYPVGYLLLWESTADSARSIGVDRKQAAVQYLVIDGQQRLTSLYAVLRGHPVKRQNFSEERIPIAFHPLDGVFEVADAAIRRDPTWISDISQVWDPDSSPFTLLRSYLERVGKTQELDAATERRVEESIQKLHGLQSFPFTALQLSATLDEEQVAEVFVRINSKGTPLNQADFILTLMSVFRDTQRTALEEFCRKARLPATQEASPFNHFIEPDPDHLLRVAVGLGFRRARLQHVYSILRGKDLETGEFSEKRRARQFDVLDQAQVYSLSLQHWHDFFKCLLRAGYRSRQVISSRNAILYAYTMYLIGRRDYRIKPRELRQAIARWFYFVALTGRYTASPESQMEQDLADLREISTAENFLAWLDRTIVSTFTADYWAITLPNDLATSSARSPGLFAYYAALNIVGAKVLFSELRVSDLMDPATRAHRAALERHHLFPKAYLHRQGIRGRRDTNQIANYALLEWPDNSAISDAAPAEYYPQLVESLGWTPEQEAEVCRWHALPEGWYEMEYQEFLAARRRQIAEVVRTGFEALGEADAREENADTPSDSPESPMAPPLSGVDRVLGVLDEDAGAIFSDLVEESLLASHELRAEVAGHLAKLEALKDFHENLDLDTARVVADRCLRLVDLISEDGPVESRRLAQAAARYFVVDEDAESDFHSLHGFDDDLGVVEAVEAVLSVDALAVQGS